MLDALHRPSDNLSERPEIVAKAELLWELATQHPTCGWGEIGRRAGFVQMEQEGVLTRRQWPGGTFRWAVVAFCERTGRPYPYRQPYHPARTVSDFVIGLPLR